MTQSLPAQWNVDRQARWSLVRSKGRGWYILKHWLLGWWLVSSAFMVAIAFLMNGRSIHWMPVLEVSGCSLVASFFGGLKTWFKHEKAFHNFSKGQV